MTIFMKLAIDARGSILDVGWDPVYTSDGYYHNFENLVEQRKIIKVSKIYF